MEYSEFDRHPAYASSERRVAGDRRDAVRRQADRAERVRDMAAFVISLCGGLAVLFLFFVIIGTVNVGDAAVATGVAIALALVWLFFFARRMRTGALVVQRPDRERRGF